MSRTKYREERTLARGLRRLPGEDRISFRQNVARLRGHFEQFNVDVSELCQWLMGLRPEGKKCGDETRPFWESVIGLEKTMPDVDEGQSDRLRLTVFEAAVGWEQESTLIGKSFPTSFMDSVRAVAAHPRTPTAARMLSRLEKMSRPHRMILLKVAAEWIAKYLTGLEGWKRRQEEWNKEKSEWEKEHPELTEDIRRMYNDIFKELGIEIKAPRICSWERLTQMRDNCEYAGERIPCGNKWKNHSALCKKYKDFLGTYKWKQNNHKRFFAENAQRYLAVRMNERLSKRQALEKLWKEFPKAKWWFEDAWEGYLPAMEINEETILTRYGGRIPHCTRFGDKDDCCWNPHTADCGKYRELLENLPQSYLDQEKLYREWRREYLSGPRKPIFRYPSCRTLPVPKIFGKGFYAIEFDKCVLRLRLDDMAEGEYLSFGFKPWPADYDVLPDSAEITSVQVHFVGTRARAGFRFRIGHKPSRIRISQDEIDALRSREFPRAAQDQKFLDAVRVRLLAGFPGDPKRELRILAVDLGDRGASVGLFAGKELLESKPLKIIKMDKLYDRMPEVDQEGGKKSENYVEPGKRKGLDKDHVGRHLKSWAEGAGVIAQKREGTDAVGLGTYDMRRLSLHIRWMIRDWVRLNVSQVITEAERAGVDLIVFESLRGFSAPGYDKLDQEKKRRLAFFAYGRIRRKATEKAVERGMRVVTVPYRDSSQICSVCGKKQENRGRWNKNKRGRQFDCEYCGFKANSDDNAARVLGRVFWGDIQLPAQK